MINYNPKEWFTFIFQFSKADTFRKLLPLMIGVSIYSGLIAYLELKYIKEHVFLKNVGMLHTVLGFVISLLLVFRTNTAYDRWWEGRKIWGTLTNSSRNLAIKINALLTNEADRQYFRQSIPTFAFALKAHLRDNDVFAETDHELQLEKEKHLPNQIAASMYVRLKKIYSEKKIDNAELRMVNEELRQLSEVCGACERIKNTPIPFTYSVFIKKFIFFYVMTLPFGWAFNLGYYVIPVVVLILYAFASLELIAEEIENPFGQDANDLPLDQICINIRKHVGEIIG